MIGERPLTTLVLLPFQVSESAASFFAPTSMSSLSDFLLRSSVSASRADSFFSRKLLDLLPVFFIS